MRALADETRETCFLGIREDRSVLYVAKADSPQPVRPAAQIGTRNPLHSTGIGKAMLAFAPADDLRAYCEGEMPAKTPNTITDAGRLAAEACRRSARAATRSTTWRTRTASAASRARSATTRGEVVAALSVSAPAYRFALEDLPALAPRVLAAAAEISSRIGYRQGGGHG